MSDTTKWVSWRNWRLPFVAAAFVVGQVVGPLFRRRRDDDDSKRPPATPSPDTEKEAGDADVP